MRSSASEQADAATMRNAKGAVFIREPTPDDLSGI